MYTKIYFIYYSFLKGKKSFDPTFNAVSIVYLTQIIHFFMLFILLGKLFDFEIPKLSETGGTNKILFLPIAVVWFYLCLHYLRKKLLKADLRNVLENNNFGDVKVLIVFIFTFLIPLYFLITLSGGQIWK